LIAESHALYGYPFTRKTYFSCISPLEDVGTNSIPVSSGKHLWCTPVRRTTCVGRSLVIDAITSWKFILEVSTFWDDGRRVNNLFSFDARVVIANVVKENIGNNTTFVYIVIKQFLQFEQFVLNAPVKLEEKLAISQMFCNMCKFIPNICL
jgi:hypothetical protein